MFVAVAHVGAEGQLWGRTTPCEVPPDAVPDDPPPEDPPVEPDDPPAVPDEQSAVTITCAHVDAAETAVIAYGDRCVVVPDTVWCVVSTLVPGRICHEPLPYVAARSADASVEPRLTES
jgi:hypothetical protein